MIELDEQEKNNGNNDKENQLDLSCLNNENNKQENNNDENNNDENNNNKSTLEMLNELKATVDNVKSENEELYSQLTQYKKLFEGTYSNSESKDTNKEKANFSKEDIVKALKEEKEREKIENERIKYQEEQAELEQELGENIQRVGKKNPEIYDLMKDKNVYFPTHLKEACYYLPNNGELVLTLLKNKNKLKEMSKMSVHKQLKELASISAKVSNIVEKKEKNSSTKNTSNSSYIKTNPFDEDNVHTNKRGDSNSLNSIHSKMDVEEMRRILQNS